MFSFNIFLTVNNSVLVESTPQFIVVPWKDALPSFPHAAGGGVGKGGDGSPGPFTLINRGVGSTGMVDTVSTELFTGTEKLLTPFYGMPQSGNKVILLYS